MARYIDADRFRYELNILYCDSRGERRNGVGESIDILTMMPTIEARPVVHGKWLHDSATGIAFCSVCNMDAVEDGTNFCPECGADMQGE